MRMFMVNQPRVIGADAESQAFALDAARAYSSKAAMAHPYFVKLLPDEEERQWLADGASSFSNLLKRAADHLLNRSEHKEAVFIEKSPIHTLFYPKIHVDFEKPRFVVVVREEGAIIHSMVQARWIPLIGKRVKEIYGLRVIPYLAATLICFDYMDVISSFKRTHEYHEVRYEHLVTLHPDEARKYLSRLIGIDLEPLYIERPFSPEASSRERTLHLDRTHAYISKTPRFIIHLNEMLFRPPISPMSKVAHTIFNVAIKLRRARSNRPVVY